MSKENKLIYMKKIQLQIITFKNHILYIGKMYLKNKRAVPQQKEKFLSCSTTFKEY